MDTGLEPGLAEGQYYEWSPPNYCSSVAPKLQFTAPFERESRLSMNFYRLAKWAPDGACALTVSEYRTFRIHSLLREGNNYSLSPQIPLAQASSILDALWFPTASMKDPASFCFMASVRESPVKLLDASNGRLRASYRIIDHRERVIAPHSMAFDLTATQLYCGCEDFIEVFDVHRPGDGKRLPTSPSKKSKEGLKGIISSLAINPDYSGTYAAGTFSSSPHAIGLFDPDVGPNPTLFLGHVRRGGVTQIMFHPTRQYVIYAASRRSGYIQIWDLRNPHELTGEFLRGAENNGTNQRLRFDIDIGGKWLATGEEKGTVSLFDVSSATEEQYPPPKLQYQAHDDSIGSVAFHPIDSIALTVSGSRRFERDSPGTTWMSPLRSLTPLLTGSREWEWWHRARC
ncbi:hypothetical protein BS47DRAFT_1319637 [Hydnum rufescens UP504]|uniref:Uncharacterized protein n=1 Tax=Hydnum rufescens UP504 TaxID=1448309 RepID=A0A9P6DUC9_9AGAM|nr:hypothetical protein BS47DRAFT_1319637 [Hydnum rufescens UP504]